MTTNEPTLRRGDQSVDGWVEYLQELLHQGVDSNVVVDGDFGPATEAAVIRLQQQRGLMVDGIVGNQTWAALRQEAPQAPSTDGRTPHSYVERGPEARWWQDHHAARYDDSSDTLFLVAVSTGDQPLAGGTFRAQGSVTLPDGSTGSVVFDSWTESGNPAGPGEPLFFGGTGLKSQGGSGDYQVTATLPAELGSDTMESKFTIA